MVYRVLEATRLYATEKLAAGDETPRTARRHAEHHLTLIETAPANWRSDAGRRWLRLQAGRIDELSRRARRLNLARLVQHGRFGNPVGAGFCAPIAVPPSLSLAGCVCRKSRRARGRWARRWKRHDHDPAIFLERHRSPIDRAQIPSRRRFADMETNEAFGRFVVHDRDIPGPADRGSR
jgi:hypothetical protein